MFPVIRGCARARNTVDSGNLVCQSLIANDGVLDATKLALALGLLDKAASPLLDRQHGNS